MKNIFLILLFIAQFGYSQVGIGTTEPTPGYSLDVNGSKLVQDEFKVNNYTTRTLNNTDYKLLVRLLNSSPVGKVAYLDLNSVPTAPVNVADYVFTNLQKDNVTAVDLQFDADKYIVGIANLRHVGEHVVKIGGDNIGYFVNRTYVDGVTNTWHIEIRNRTLDSPNDNAVEYHVTLIVYDKAYFKSLPVISYDFGGSATTGTIPAPAGL
jgi:hypothetical protein